MSQPPPLLGNRCKLDINTNLVRRKYQFMEVNTQRRAFSLRDKIPDIQKTLDTVRFLKFRKVSVATAATDLSAWRRS